MSSQKKRRTKAEVLALLAERRAHPIYTHSVEFEGMSLSFVNPEIIAGEVAREKRRENGEQGQSEMEGVTDA